MAETKKKTGTATTKVEKPAEEKVVQKKAPIQQNEKLADPSAILRTYDLLIKQLKEAEKAQRLKNKPFRIYFIHKHKVEVLKQNFIKMSR